MDKRILGLASAFLLSCMPAVARTGKIFDIQTVTVTLVATGQVHTFAHIGIQDGANVFPYVLPLIDPNGVEYPGAKFHLSLCQQALASKSQATLTAVAEAGTYAGDPWSLGASDLYPNGYSKPRIKKVALGN